MRLSANLGIGISASIATLLFMTAANSAPVYATSYNMQNGQSGSYSYWDGSYSGSGDVTVNLSSLSGGLGELTDGVVPADDWTVTEAPAGDGPYIGWISIDPVITFFFGAITQFATATFYFDDTNGFGGVFAPSRVRLNGTDYLVDDPAGSGPFAFTVDLAGISDDELSFQVFRRGSNWLFMSEVTFDDGRSVASVPVPAAGLLLIGALGGIAALRHRARAA